MQNLNRRVELPIESGWLIDSLHRHTEEASARRFNRAFDRRSQWRRRAVDRRLQRRCIWPLYRWYQWRHRAVDRRLQWRRSWPLHRGDLFRFNGSLRFDRWNRFDGIVRRGHGINLRSRDGENLSANLAGEPDGVVIIYGS
jgi:hypothetical protein